MNGHHRKPARISRLSPITPSPPTSRLPVSRFTGRTPRHATIMLPIQITTEPPVSRLSAHRLFSTTRQHGYHGNLPNNASTTVHYLRSLTPCLMAPTIRRSVTAENCRLPNRINGFIINVPRRMPLHANIVSQAVTPYAAAAAAAAPPRQRLRQPQRHAASRYASSHRLHRHLVFIVIITPGFTVTLYHHHSTILVRFYYHQLTIPPSASSLYHTVISSYHAQLEYH